MFVWSYVTGSGGVILAERAGSIKHGQVKNAGF